MNLKEKIFIFSDAEDSDLPLVEQYLEENKIPYTLIPTVGSPEPKLKIGVNVFSGLEDIKRGLMNIYQKDNSFCP